MSQRQSRREQRIQATFQDDAPTAQPGYSGYNDDFENEDHQVYIQEYNQHYTQGDDFDGAAYMGPSYSGLEEQDVEAFEQFVPNLETDNPGLEEHATEGPPGEQHVSGQTKVTMTRNRRSQRRRDAKGRLQRRHSGRHRAVALHSEDDHGSTHGSHGSAYGSPEHMSGPTLLTMDSLRLHDDESIGEHRSIAATRDSTLNDYETPNRSMSTSTPVELEQWVDSTIPFNVPRDSDGALYDSISSNQSLDLPLVDEDDVGGGQVAPYSDWSVEVQMLDSRPIQQTFAPIGHMAELYSDIAIQCREESHPPLALVPDPLSSLPGRQLDISERHDAMDDAGTSEDDIATTIPGIGGGIKDDKNDTRPEKSKGPFQTLQGTLGKSNRSSESSSGPPSQIPIQNYAPTSQGSLISASLEQTLVDRPLSTDKHSPSAQQQQQQEQLPQQFRVPSPSASGLSQEEVFQASHSPIPQAVQTPTAPAETPTSGKHDWLNKATNFLKKDAVKKIGSAVGGAVVAESLGVSGVAGAKIGGRIFDTTRPPRQIQHSPLGPSPPGANSLDPNKPLPPGHILLAGPQPQPSIQGNSKGKEFTKLSSEIEWDETEWEEWDELDTGPISRSSMTPAEKFNKPTQFHHREFARDSYAVGNSLGFRESDSFRSLLANSYNEKNGHCTLETAVDWDLPKFCRAELGLFALSKLVVDIPKILTVTSPGMTFTTTQAASCEDYTRLVWGSRGEEILRSVLSNALQEGPWRFEVSDLSLQVSFQRSENSVSKGTAVLSINGRPRDVADVLEQFAWIACTFRPPSSQFPLSRSTVTIRHDPVHTKRHRFCLEPPTAHQDSFCWTSIIPSAMVATGFPIRRRLFEGHNMLGEGIEIPFEIMASLARISALTELDGCQLLVGPSMVLYPTKLLAKPLSTAVQWHCVQSRSLGTLDTDRILRSIANGGQIKLDMADLVGCRCFLGYFEQATVHLGTEAPAEREVVPLGLDKAKQRIELAREGTFTMGFSIPGIINGNIGGKILLTRSLQVARREDKEYEDLLADSKSQAVVLHDMKARTAWLVSELSVVLHLCLTFLKLPATQPRFRGEIPSLPLATPTGDGGSSALDTILANGDLRLWRRAEGNEYKTFQSLVGDFLRDVRNLGNASLLQQRPSTASQLFPELFPALNGWEFADIVNRKDIIDEKKLPRERIPSWFPLCQERSVYAIFHSELDQVIRPVSRVPPGWEYVVQGADLLVASMPCVWQLHNLAKHPNSNDCLGYHITDNLVMGFQCRQCKDPTAHPVRTLHRCRGRPFSSNGNIDENSYVLRNGPSLPGALIFGDHSLFHKVLNQLSRGTRRLDRQVSQVRQT